MGKASRRIAPLICAVVAAALFYFALIPSKNWETMNAIDCEHWPELSTIDGIEESDTIAVRALSVRQDAHVIRLALPADRRSRILQALGVSDSLIDEIRGNNALERIPGFLKRDGDNAYAVSMPGLRIGDCFIQPYLMSDHFLILWFQKIPDNS